MELRDGEVLVTSATGESFNSFLHVVGAIVTDHGSFASHAAIMGREMGFPAVVGTVDGTQSHPERCARAGGRQGRHGRDRRLPRRRLGRFASTPCRRRACRPGRPVAGTARGLDVREEHAVAHISAVDDRPQCRWAVEAAEDPAAAMPPDRSRDRAAARDAVRPDERVHRSPVAVECVEPHPSRSTEVVGRHAMRSPFGPRRTDVCAGSRGQREGHALKTSPGRGM